VPLYKRSIREANIEKSSSPIHHSFFPALKYLRDERHVVFRVFRPVALLLHLKQDPVFVEVRVAVGNAQLVHFHVGLQVLDALRVLLLQDFVALLGDGGLGHGKRVEELHRLGGVALHLAHLVQHVGGALEAGRFGQAHLLADLGGRKEEGAVK